MCPNCRQDAPLVYRGITAYCSACGATRMPVTGSAMNLAGQPSRVGSFVARGLGWFVLVGGIFLAAVLTLVGQAIWPTGFAGYLVGGPVAAVSMALAWALLRTGRELGESGRATARGAQEAAVNALASHRGGSLTAMDVSQALGLPFERADALLTTMAKSQSHYERIDVDVDPNGAVVYRFHRPLPEEQAMSPRTRVSDEIARSPNRAEWERLEAESQGEDGRANVDGRPRRR